jgi:hypothetical protein
VAKPAKCILRGDGVDALADRLFQCLPGSCSLPAQKGLELGEGLFDGREIGRIGGQEPQLTAAGLNGLAHTGTLMSLRSASITTICPACKLGARNSVMDNSNAKPVVAPSRIMAAPMPSSEREAINVVLAPRLRGTLPKARWPLGALA